MILHVGRNTRNLYCEFSCLKTTRKAKDQGMLWNCEDVIRLTKMEVSFGEELAVIRKK